MNDIVLSNTCLGAYDCGAPFSKSKEYGKLYFMQAIEAIKGSAQ